MARRAVLQVERPAARGPGALGHRAGPWDVVRVHVQKSRSPDRTRSRPTRRRRRSRERRPCRGRAESGTNGPSLRNVENRSTAHWCASGVRVGQHVARQQLPGERFGHRRDRLRVVRRFAGQIALRKMTIFDGKQRLAVRAIEREDEALLAGLHDGVNRPAVPLEPRRAWAATESRDPRCRAGRPGNARCARRCRPSAQSGSWRRGCRPDDSRRRNPLPPIRSVRRRCRRASSRAMPVQLLAPPLTVHESFAHVSYPASPGCGIVWNAHRSFPVRTSYARMSPGDAGSPSLRRPPTMKRSL